MRSVGAPRAVAYSVYHAYAQNKISIPETGMDPFKIKRHPVYSAIIPYLLPGQITPEEMVKKKNDYFIYYEFFTRDAAAGAITSERDRHGKKARSELVDKVFSPATAKDAAQLDDLGGPMYRIIFEDKSAGLK
jgi:hypothetical protein